MEDSDRPSLADRRDLTEVALTLGDADLFVYVNAQIIQDVLLNSAPQQEKEKLISRDVSMKRNIPKIYIRPSPTLSAYFPIGNKRITVAARKEVSTNPNLPGLT